jgi:hypothetical protein
VATSRRPLPPRAGEASPTGKAPDRAIDARGTPRRSPKRAESPPRDVDWFEEAAKIRRELAGETECSLDWLDDLDHVRRELNDNVFQSSCIDNSPVTAFTRGSHGAAVTDDLVETAQNMLDGGFDAIHAMLAREGRLLERRAALLQQMHDALVAHSCDYTADVERDDYDIEIDGGLEVAASPMRPKTAARRIEIARALL